VAHRTWLTNTQMLLLYYHIFVKKIPSLLSSMPR
jgi:hypothetical protein